MLLLGGGVFLCIDETNGTDGQNAWKLVDGIEAEAGDALRVFPQVTGLSDVKWNICRMLFAVCQKTDVEFGVFIQLLHGLRSEEQLAAGIGGELVRRVGDGHVFRVFRFEIARLDHEAEVRSGDVDDDAVRRERVGGAIGRRPAVCGVVERPLLRGEQGGGEQKCHEQLVHVVSLWFVVARPSRPCCCLW